MLPLEAERNVHTACFAVKGPGGEEHSLFHSPSCDI